MTWASLPTSLVSASSLASQRAGSGASAGPLAGLFLRAALESMWGGSERAPRGRYGWSQALGRVAVALRSFSRGHWRLAPPPAQELWLAYRLPVSGGSSERLLGFQPQVCDSGDVRDPEGRWVAPLRIGLRAPRLPWVISGLGQAGKVRSCVYLLHFPPEIGLPQSPLVLPPSHAAVSWEVRVGRWGAPRQH